MRFASNRHIIVLVVETLRPDHMSLYGYQRLTTPYLEQLAEFGTVFDQCFTVAPRTWQAFASLVTGRYPHRHGMRFVGDKPLAPEIPVLGEILKAAGFIGFGDTGDMKASKIGRGFDTYEPQPGNQYRTINRILEWMPWQKRTPGAQSTPPQRDRGRSNRLLKWLAAHHNRPTFALLRYYTPHWPYVPPRSYVERFESCDDISHRFNDYEQRYKLIFENYLTQAERDHAIAHYDGAIAFIDHEIKCLVKELKTMGAWDETLLIVTADHGEGLGDHDYWFEHGDQLYDEAIHIPCLMTGPDVPRGQRISEQVQIIDLLPTILEWANATLPSGLDGVSLWALMHHRSQGREYVFAESGRDFHGAPWRNMTGVSGYLRMVRTPSWKLIYTPQHFEHHFELYHLETDPGEHENVFTRYTDVSAQLKEVLVDWLRSDKIAQHAAKQGDIHPEVAQRLRSLGYLS